MLQNIACTMYMQGSGQDEIEHIGVSAVYRLEVYFRSGLMHVPECITRALPVCRQRSSMQIGMPVLI